MYTTVMEVTNIGSYMFGEFCSLLTGIIVGAIIVGISWSCANAKVQEALNQANWDHDGELKRVKAKLLKRAMKKEENKAINEIT